MLGCKGFIRLRPLALYNGFIWFAKSDCYTFGYNSCYYDKIRYYILFLTDFILGSLVCLIVEYLLTNWLILAFWIVSSSFMPILSFGVISHEEIEEWSISSSTLLYFSYYSSDQSYFPSGRYFFLIIKFYKSNLILL